MSGRIDKTLRPLVRAATDAGFELVKPPRRNNHFRLVAPGGEWFTLATSGKRALPALRTFLRRHGLQV